MLILAAQRGTYTALVIGNWFVLRGGEELEALGQEWRQFITIASNVVQDVLHRRAKLRERGVEPIVGNLALEKFPVHICT